MPKRVPGYRLHKSSGQAIVRLNGHMLYLGPWKSQESHQAYDRHIAEWLSRSRQPAPIVKQDQGKLTIVELVAFYWPVAERHYRKPDGTPTGELHPLRTALRILKQIYGSTPADEFGPLKLAALREAMIVQGWARSTVNGQVKRVVRLFRWAVSREMLPATVPQALRELPGLERGRTEARETEAVLPVTDADFQATLHHLPEVVADLLRVQRLTGMRPNEVCQLRPADIDRTAAVWLFTPRTHKTAHKGRPRVIAIGPRAQAVLIPYLLRGADDLCFSPAESERKRRGSLRAKRVTPLGYGNGPGDNVKDNPQRTAGKSYNATSLRHAIERACKTAKVKPWSANQLRHSFLTEVRAKFGLEAAQVSGGHATANVTEIYAERDIAKAVSVAGVVG